MSLLLLLPAQTIVRVTLYFSQLDCELAGSIQAPDFSPPLPQKVLSKSWGSGLMDSCEGPRSWPLTTLEVEGLPGASCLGWSRRGNSCQSLGFCSPQEREDRRFCVRLEDAWQETCPGWRSGGENVSPVQGFSVSLAL